MRLVIQYRNIKKTITHKKTPENSSGVSYLILMLLTQHQSH